MLCCLKVCKFDARVRHVWAEMRIRPRDVSLLLLEARSRPVFRCPATVPSVAT